MNQKEIFKNVEEYVKNLGIELQDWQMEILKDCVWTCTHEDYICISGTKGKKKDFAYITAIAYAYMKNREKNEEFYGN